MIDVPASALDKLNQLSNVAATLGAKVVQMQQAIAAARFRLTGSFAQDCEYRDTRATLDQLIRNLPQLERQRDNAKEIYAACRAWLDELPSGTILEEATAKLDGDTLASVRQRIAALESERTTIETAKAQRTKLQQAAAPRIIKQYGKASAPVVHLDRVDTFDLASSKWFGFLCYANPELVAKGLKRAVEDKASRLPTVVECVKRSGILDYQLIQQCYLEEALIERALHDGKIIERRSDAPAQAILMVRVAKEAMRAERAKRVERRSSAAA